MNNTSYNPKLLMFLLIIMGSLSQFSADNFLPSLPYIAHDLNATASLTKLSISIYLLGLCTSTLIYGPLADAFGRRRLVLIGYSIFLIGCILVTTTHTIDQLLWGRFIQACGIGAAIGLFRAILRDAFSGTKLAQASSYLGAVFAVVPPLAPLTGGYIQAHLGWRYNFLLLLVLAVISIIIIALYLPETLHPEHRYKSTFSEILKTYMNLLTHRAFIGYCACSSLAFANIIAYVTVSPFLFQETLKLSPIEFGWLAPLVAVGAMIGNLLNSRLLNFYSSQTLLRFAGFFMLAPAFIMLGLGLLGYLNVWVIMIPMILLTMANGFVFTNAFACAFEPFSQSAGATGALFTSLQMLTSGIVGSFATLIPTHNQLIIATVFLLISCLIILNNKYVLRL